MSHHNAAGGNGDDEGNSVTLDPQGRILVTGSSDTGYFDDMVIWRYLPGGILDTDKNNGFGESDGTSRKGFVWRNSATGGAPYDNGNSITIDPLGRILVTGVRSNAFDLMGMVIWCYDSNGVSCGGFGSLGVVFPSCNAMYCSDGGTSINVQRTNLADPQDYRLLVTGYSLNVPNNSDDMVIWRYLPNGILDTDLNNGFGEIEGTSRKGFVVHPSGGPGNGQDHGNSIALDFLGRILVTRAEQ